MSGLFFIGELIKVGKVVNSTKSTKKELFLRSYAKTLGHISNSCKAIKIDRGTYYNWMENDPDFKKAVLYIDDSFIDLAESKLRENIENKVQKAIEFYLCNQKKSKYSHTFRGELSGVGGEPIKYVIEKSYEKPEKPKLDEKEPKTDKTEKSEIAESGDL